MVKYTPKQRELMRLWQHNELARLNLLEGSVSSGKTWISLVLWAFWVKTMPADGLYMMCAKSLTTLKRNCLLLLQDQVGESNFRFSLPAKEGYLFGRRVLLEGANDARSESKIRGLTLQGAYCDELTQFPEDFFAMLLSRLRMPGAKLFATTNPDRPNHWLKVNYIDRADELDFLDVQFTIDDNTELDPEYVENIKREYTGVFYQRFILGLWVVAEGLVYPMFDPAKHVTEKRTSGEYYIAVDYGTVNPCAMELICLHNGEAHVCDEYYYNSREKNNRRTDEEHYKGLEKLAEGHEIKRVIVDPSAASFKETIRRHGKFAVWDADNSVLDGIRLTGTLLQAGKITMSAKCDGLIQEIQSYVWDEDAPEDAVIKENDHACLTGDTLVETVAGPVAIKDLVGKTGLVYCAHDGKAVLGNYHNVRMTQEQAEVFEIELTDGKTVKATADHPMLTKRGWVQVKDLRGDRIACLGSGYVPIKEIRPAGKEPVYNMEVDRYHNFAVNGGIITHNCDALRYFCQTIMRRYVRANGL